MSDKKASSPQVKTSTPQTAPQPRVAINESRGSVIRNRDVPTNFSGSRENSKQPVTAKDATGSTGPKGPS